MLGMCSSTEVCHLTSRNYNLYDDFTAFISLSNINLETGSIQRICKFFEVVLGGC